MAPKNRAIKAKIDKRYNLKDPKLVQNNLAIQAQMEVLKKISKFKNSPTSRLRQKKLSSKFQ